MSSTSCGDNMIGEGVHFERIRRITGYLVGGLDRFNDAKLAEVKDRVKHCNMGSLGVIPKAKRSLVSVAA